ncbi:MAG: T9SS type A sorting domain-containing protein [Thermaurantimonas sp.]
MTRLLCLLILTANTITSQHIDFLYKQKSVKPDGVYFIRPFGGESDFFSHVQHLEAPYPGGSGFRSFLLSLKDSINRLPRLKSLKRTQMAVPLPVVDLQFEGNEYNGSAPNDNHIAMSKNGLIVSVINTNILLFDSQGDSILSVQSLQQFCASTGLTDAKYDPRILYDPDEDRFIIVILNGFTWQTSRIVVGFSRSNNPHVDGWNLYVLNGNPLNNQTWSDYPHLAVSKSDLFITFNTFLNGSFNNSGYVESTFWQIDKMAGYNGSAEMSTSYFYDIRYRPDGADTLRPMFNFTPIKGGSGHYGDKMFLLSNENLAASSNRYFLLTVEGKTGQSTLSVSEFRTETVYGLPPDARQMANHRFDCVDARIQDGFLENNVLHFVHNTISPLNGAGFIYGRIDRPEGFNKSIKTIHYFHDSLDFGFPAISYSGRTVLENDAIITFNHCGRNYPSGMSACYVDSDGNLSERQEIERGNGYVDVLGIGVQRFYERWGDYSGGQRIYQSPGRVIGAGYGSKANRRPETRIAVLSSPLLAGSAPAPFNFASEFKLFPNPANRFFEVEFVLEQAQRLRFVIVPAFMGTGGEIVLQTSDVRKGTNRFTFYTSPLRNGLYTLLIQSEDGQIIKKSKVMVIR